MAVVAMLQVNQQTPDIDSMWVIEGLSNLLGYVDGIVGGLCSSSA